LLTPSLGVVLSIANYEPVVILAFNFNVTLAQARVKNSGIHLTSPFYSFM